jgi:NAD(P)H-dependent FMN reductase
VAIDIQTVSVLAISGSLRAASSNGALVAAFASSATEAVRISIYRGLAELPHFNPDLDDESPAAPVAEFRSALRACDAVLISSPEYAHGVPGVLKNALDWIVGSGELIDKPIALINVSPRATHAQASLTETLTVMSAKIVADASITLPLAGRALDAAGILADVELSSALRVARDALVRAVPAVRVGGDVAADR